jgi:hypothetical protein
VTLLTLVVDEDDGKPHCAFDHSYRMLLLDNLQLPYFFPTTVINVVVDSKPLLQKDLVASYIALMYYGVCGSNVQC